MGERSSRILHLTSCPSAEARPGGEPSWAVHALVQKNDTLKHRNASIGSQGYLADDAAAAGVLLSVSHWCQAPVLLQIWAREALHIPCHPSKGKDVPYDLHKVRMGCRQK